MKSKVVVAVCDSYEKDKVYSAVKGAMQALGGLAQFVGPDEKILVKPNLLYGTKGEQCITTNPQVISAVLRMLNENEYHHVKIGDSPAVGSCADALSSIGLTEEMFHGAAIAPMNKEHLTEYPEGQIARSFWFAEDVTEAGAIIGVCKMKTHQLERITGAVKNMYGLICGKRKALGHVSYPTAAHFARMMADMHNCVKPRFHIMDAVVAMEGNGPASGSPVQMGLILASADPVALDSVFARLIALDPVLVPTETYGKLQGVGTYKLNEMELMLWEDGQVLEVTMDQLFARFGKPDFDVQREKDGINLLSMWSHFTGKLTKKPAIDPAKCVKCGLCVNHCPVEGRAINFKNGKDQLPVYDYRKCIRCFCCQEICPQHAIHVK